MDIAVVVGPDVVVLHFLLVCCPALWWNYLGIIVSRVNPVSSHGAHTVVLRSRELDTGSIEDWRGFSDLSEVGLIYCGAEDKERGRGKFQGLGMAAVS